MKTSFWRFLGLLILVLFISVGAVAAPVTITNGTTWRDTSSNTIHAHGGGMIKSGSYYYWFGENRWSDQSFRSVNCYRSTNLKDWTFVNDVLTENSASELGYAKIERPKVIYCSSTGNYVMWMHKEGGDDYGEARWARAKCSSISGNYTYLGSGRYNNHMSRDCTAYVDSNGAAYFISAADNNYDLNMYRLTSNYESIDYLVQVLWDGGHREAPCVVKRGSYYFLMSSGCTGWSPNQGKYGRATSMTGSWSSTYNVGDSWQFDSQPTYIQIVSGSSTTSYLYMGDRWMDPDYASSKYVWLPINFPSDSSMSMDWNSDVTIDTATGEIELGGGGGGGGAPSGTIRLEAVHSGKVMDVAGQSTSEGANVAQWSYWGGNNQKWTVIQVDSTYYRLRNVNSSRYLNVADGSTSNGGNIEQSSTTGNSAQWRFNEVGTSTYNVINRNSGKYADVSGASTDNGANVLQWSANGGNNQKWKAIAS